MKGGEQAAGMIDAARAAIGCLAVSQSDVVLVVCNPETRSLAEALLEAAGEVTGSATLLEYRTLSRDGEEPPAAVAAALSTSSVVLAPTAYSFEPYVGARQGDPGPAPESPPSSTSTKRSSVDP